jgi:hypothetical protein
MTTKTDSANTPGPWLEKDGMIYDNSGHTIAITSLSVSADPKENSAFIVRACNSHAELVGALKASTVELKQTLNDIGDCDHSVGICCCDLRMLIESNERILSKAGGK